MRHKVTVLLLMLAITLSAATAQNRERMTLHQQRLAELLMRTASAPTDNERYLASEQAVLELLLAFVVVLYGAEALELAVVAYHCPGEDAQLRMKLKGRK